MYFGIKDDQLSVYASLNVEAPENYWKDLPMNQRQQVITEIESKSSKEVLFWNYEHIAAEILHLKTEDIALAISLLCNRAVDEKMYMMLFRNKLKKPFINHEIQLIKIVSRIVGWHLNYEFTYQVLMYQFEKSFRRKLI